MQDPNTDKLDIHDNFGQGTEGVAYGFPAHLCENRDNPMIRDNTGGVIGITGVVVNSVGSKCFWHGRVNIYHSRNKGVIVNPSGTRKDIH